MFVYIFSPPTHFDFCPRLSDWVLVGPTAREGSDKNLLIKQIEQLRRLNLITNQISTETNCKKIIERQRQIYPSVFLRLTSDMDTDAPRIDERKRMRVSSPVPAPPRYDEDGDLQADEIGVDLTDELKHYTDVSSSFDTNPVIIDPPGIDELLLQRNELFQKLYEELDSLKNRNLENGDLQKLFKNMTPLPTTTQLGGLCCGWQWSHVFEKFL